MERTRGEPTREEIAKARLNRFMHLCDELEIQYMFLDGSSGVPEMREPIQERINGILTTGERFGFNRRSIELVARYKINKRQDGK